MIEQENMELDKINNLCVSQMVINLKNGYELAIYISGTPQLAGIDDFSQYMKEKEVTDIFCFCDRYYDLDVFKKNEINFHDLPFADGTVPNQTILLNFNDKLKTIMTNSNSKKCSINLHCRSGLGRAPIMLAHIMIIWCKMDRCDCVEQIRKIRPKAFNKKQLEWVLNHKTNKNNSCVII